MPLDDHKARHIRNVVARSFVGRQRTVTVVYRTADGYSYSTIQAILRPLDTHPPTIPDRSGNTSTRKADAWLIAPLDTDLDGAICIAVTATATAEAVAGALKYEIIDSLPAGLLPDGSHLRVSLRRLP